MSTKATILFVDDEERILRSLKMLFIGKFNVKITTDGNEALKILKAEKVHVLVSDQRMPIMMGVDLLRQARQVSPNTMRLLLTGYSDLSAIVGSVNDGEIYRYINKPWKADELKSTIIEAAEIALRLDTAHTNEVSEKAASSPPSAKDSPGILVMDGEEDTYKTVAHIANNQYPVHWASGLEDAFAILSEKDIALVVSEIMLNGEDVSGPIKTLKQYNPNILTITLTSFQDTSALIELINQGQVYRFLPKPIHEGLLAKSIQAALQRYNLLRNTPQLLLRHKVEKPKTNTSIPNKVLGYLKRIRERNGAAKA